MQKTHRKVIIGAPVVLLLALHITAFAAQPTTLSAAAGTVLAQEVLADAVGAAKNGMQTVLTIHGSRGGNQVGNITMHTENPVRGDVQTDGVAVTSVGRLAIEDSRVKNVEFRSRNDVGSISNAGLRRVSLGDLAIESSKVGNVKINTENRISGDIRNYAPTATKVGTVGIRNTKVGEVNVIIRNRVSGSVRTTGAASTIIGSAEV